MTALVMSLIMAVPPKSQVCSFGLAVTFSVAAINLAAKVFSPKKLSIITADQKVPIELASTLPMMSKADPWIGSNIDG